MKMADSSLITSFTGIGVTREYRLAKWQEAIDFLETNRRKPSKFILEERNLRSWWKHNKKLMNAGELKAERVN